MSSPRSAAQFDPLRARELGRTIDISENSEKGLHETSVVEAWNRLPLEVGPVGTGEPAVLFPSAFDGAVAALNRAELLLYERRVEIDRREFQRTLARLVDLIRDAQRTGRAVRVTL